MQAFPNEVHQFSHGDLARFIDNMLSSRTPEKSVSLDQMDVHGVLNVKDKLSLSPQAKASLFAGLALVPTGALTPFAAATAPAGWLLCDGSAVSRLTYSALFALIGTTYGVGDGSTTFNVPDLRGRVPVGKNAATFSALAGTGGEETHLLALTEMAAHDHGTNTSAVSAGTPAGTLNAVSAGTPAGTVSTPTFTGNAMGAHQHASASTNMQYKAVFATTGTGIAVTDLDTKTGAAAGNTVLPNTNAVSAGTPSGNISTPTFSGSALGTHTHTFTGSAMGTHSHVISSAGGGLAHNNIQPYLVVNYIIKS